MRNIFPFVLLHFCLFLLLLFPDVGGISAVVFVTVGQSAIDKTHQFYGGPERDFLIGSPEDVLMENVAQSLFLHPQARDKLVIAT